MKTIATKDFPIHELLNKRWSPRAFSEKEVTQEQIDSLFEAARWAASSRNSQPWRFIYATKENKETYDKLWQVMVEWNQSWAKSAPLLILAIAETKDDKNRPQTHAYYDLGLAIGNLTTQATAEGIYLHQMGGIEPGTARELFEIPEQFEAVAIIAAGFPGELSNIPADIAEMEYHVQERKPQKEFVFRETFGK